MNLEIFAAEDISSTGSLEKKYRRW